MFEILDERVGKRSVERVRYNKNFTLKIWSHFTLTCVISHIYLYFSFYFSHREQMQSLLHVVEGGVCGTAVQV